uniref:Uncharacterized protein n=1 Tax=viral metagenome TaxID=1070528 RepID=A0A6M3KHB1_9ZZZZ
MKDLCLQTNNFHREIEAENQRQLDKWGIQDRDPFEWLGFALEELGETSDAISEHRFRGGNREAVVTEAIQTATLCIKIAEMFRHTKVI